MFACASAPPPPPRADSVPAFNIANMSKAIKDGYAAEWYWWYLKGLPTPEVIAFHNKTYGRWVPPRFTLLHVRC
eukprot:SAG22_NODE_3041_length_1998_cov_5.044760_2_plen_74_part_00